MRSKLVLVTSVIVLLSLALLWDGPDTAQGLAIFQVDGVPAREGLLNWRPGDGDAIEMNDGTFVGHATFAPGFVGLESSDTASGVNQVTKCARVASRNLEPWLEFFADKPSIPVLTISVCDGTFGAAIKQNFSENLGPNLHFVNLITFPNNHFRLQESFQTGQQPNGIVTQSTTNTRLCSDGRANVEKVVFVGAEDDVDINVTRITLCSDF